MQELQTAAKSLAVRGQRLLEADLLFKKRRFFGWMTPRHDGWMDGWMDEE